MRNDPSLREIFACQSNILKWIRYAVDDAKINQAAYESVAVQLEGYGEKSFYFSNASVSQMLSSLVRWARSKQVQRSGKLGAVRREGN